jgi:hypothetical protein
MGCAPRDILIEQVQTAPPQTFAPISQPNPSYDIRFSHAIKVLFFGAKNTSVKSYGSNYTTQHVIPVFNKFSSRDVYFISELYPGEDPISNVSLTYENTQRLSFMGSDYFTLVQPYYTAPIIPTATGYHVYSYSLNFISLDPLGSTNYGKLTNVSIAPVPSAFATWSATTDPTNDGLYVSDINTWADHYPDYITTLAGNKNLVFPNTYNFWTLAVNNNVIRISGGKHPKVPPTVGSPYGCGNTILEKECNIPLIPCF